jgi:chromosome segregation ATPase
MQPNPASTTVIAPAKAASRPQLKIAARLTEEVRDVGQTAASAVITEEVHRSHAAWRRTLDSVKETLAALERTCETALDEQEADLAGLIESLVRSATAGAESAAEQTRAQAQIEIAELQAAVDTLRADLQAERDAVKTTSAQLDAEVAARVRAEGERDEAQRTSQQIMSETESRVEAVRIESRRQQADLSLARQQLEAARAERSKLMATFESLQRVLAVGQSGDAALEPMTLMETRQFEVPADTTPDPARSFESVEPVAEDPVVEAHPEAVEDISQLLEQIEAMYSADLTSGRSPIEVVDRLTGSLRYARDVAVARWGSADCDAGALFDRQIAVLLDLKGGTSFGRHLSISAYAARTSDGVGPS